MFIQTKNQTPKIGTCQISWGARTASTGSGVGPRRAANALGRAAPVRFETPVWNAPLLAAFKNMFKISQ